MEDDDGGSDSRNIPLNVDSLGINPEPAHAQMFWGDLNGIIRRANLDGSDIQSIIPDSLDDPRGIALDPIAEKLYWVETSGSNGSEIRRANFDGTASELVLDESGDSPWSIALDVPGGKIYWTEKNYGISIRRADLDGTDIEDLVTLDSYDFNSSVWGIALDLDDGKVYWSGHSQLGRANLDGTDPEEIAIIGLVGNTRAIAIDSINDKLYIADDNTIKQTNLDGSNLDTLVTLDSGVGSPTGLALDVPGGKIYWTSPSSWSIMAYKYSVARVQRANLDGSGIEDLVTLTFGSFTDITLGPSVQEQVTSPETLSGKILQTAVSNGSPSFSDGGS